MLCHFLAAESHYEAKEYPEAMDLLNTLDLDYINGTEFANDEAACSLMFDGLSDTVSPTKAETMAAICLLRGKTLEAMDNRVLAMDCYVQALHLSVYCTEALDALVKHEMLLVSEERELIDHLPVDQQCSVAEAKLLIKLYRSKLKKYYEPNVMVTSSGNTMKTIVENMSKTVTDRATTEVKRGAKDTSKFFSPIQQNTPANRYT